MFLKGETDRLKPFVQREEETITINTLKFPSSASYMAELRIHLGEIKKKQRWICNVIFSYTRVRGI